MRVELLLLVLHAFLHFEEDGVSADSRFVVAGSDRGLSTTAYLQQVNISTTIFGSLSPINRSTVRLVRKIFK